VRADGGSIAGGSSDAHSQLALPFVRWIQAFGDLNTDASANHSPIHIIAILSLAGIGRRRDRAQLGRVLVSIGKVFVSIDRAYGR
jgi:hypothetical protein